MSSCSWRQLNVSEEHIASIFSVAPASADVLLDT
jgi:hypothetical protein